MDKETVRGSIAWEIARIRSNSLDMAIKLLRGELVTDTGNAVRKVSGSTPLTDLKLLAVAVLRDSEGDKALMAAFLDELMGSGVAEDVPVTETWCRTHGWLEDVVWRDSKPSHYRFVDCCVGQVYFVQEGREWGIFGHTDSQEGYGMSKIGNNPTVSQVVRLCRALGIPWSASDPLGK